MRRRFRRSRSPFRLWGRLRSSGLRATRRSGGRVFRVYGRRVLSGYSREVIANSIGLGVGFAAQEDPRHYPTGEHGVWRRGLYAAREAFVSRSTSGGLMPAYSRIVGAYAAGFVSNAWYPAPYSNVHGAL